MSSLTEMVFKKENLLRMDFFLSFGFQAASKREYRRMTHGRGRRVVHRNDGTLATAASSVSSKEGVVVAGASSSLVCDQEDPIRAHRVQPAYVEMAASSVPGAEVVR